ncbi:hypothetical protein QCM80_02555 [Bradyrhizobium sp. SSUT112]|uniref:hypothetical protein n=1 Tax=Bradyrhizobium sp. SSUT112 TaxID=3040604 RepID=UPI0024499918|nr:hypothetical protein [Bradyrhizobium sp. SSUT112]MDH2349565.1 hypothetical protein [Bradyrhizobium sp. SSUT112]
MKMIGWLIVVAGVLIALSGVLLLIGQGIGWLDTGHWAKIGMGVLWIERPFTNMVGLQKIYDWFFDFPLGVGAAFGGIVLANLGLKIAV